MFFIEWYKIVWKRVFKKLQEICQKPSIKDITAYGINYAVINNNSSTDGAYLQMSV